MVPIKKSRFAIITLFLLAVGACTTGGAPNGPVTADESPYDHSSFDPRPHDYRTLGMELLSSTIRPTSVLEENEPGVCHQEEFSFDHTFYITDQIHTAWHRYEENSARTFDNVVVTISEFDVAIECDPDEQNPGELFCITRSTLGIDLTTSSGGGPILKDHGWIGFVWSSSPDSCSEADHRVDYVASQATEGAIGELFKSVARTDQEILGVEP